MIEFIRNEHFIKMPWKNGKGVTSQIFIFPPDSSLAENNFTLRLSSAQIVENGEFSVFENKKRLLVAVKGAGFKLNSQIYERFEVAQFSGDDQIYCSLLKEPVIDLGLIYDSTKVQVQPKILNLKSEIEFAIDPEATYLVTILEGGIQSGDSRLEFLETIRLQNETTCRLIPQKSAVLFFCKLTFV